MEHRVKSRATKPTVSYHLFLYKQELARRNAERNVLSRTKIRIIDALVARTIRSLRKCSLEDLEACKRELLYSAALKAQLALAQRTALRKMYGKTAWSSSSSTIMQTFIIGPEIFI